LADRSVDSDIHYKHDEIIMYT